MKDEKNIQNASSETSQETVQYTGVIIDIHQVVNGIELMAFITLDDGRELAVLPKTWHLHKHNLERYRFFSTHMVFDCIEGDMTSPRFRPIVANFSPDYTYELPKTNYEKLSAALRQDMRDASEELLELHYLLSIADDPENDFFAKFMLRLFRDYVEKSLAALDCTDHLENPDATP